MRLTSSIHHFLLKLKTDSKRNFKSINNDVFDLTYFSKYFCHTLDPSMGTNRKVFSWFVTTKIIKYRLWFGFHQVKMGSSHWELAEISLIMLKKFNRFSNEFQTFSTKQLMVKQLKYVICVILMMFMTQLEY